MKYLKDLVARIEEKAQKNKEKWQLKKDEANFRVARAREIEYIKLYRSKYGHEPNGEMLGRIFNYTRQTGWKVIIDFNKFI